MAAPLSTFSLENLQEQTKQIFLTKSLNLNLLTTKLYLYMNQKISSICKKLIQSEDKSSSGILKSFLTR